MKKKVSVRFGRRIFAVLLAFVFVLTMALGTVSTAFAEEAETDNTPVIAFLPQISDLAGKTDSEANAVSGGGSEATVAGAAPQSAEDPEPTEVIPLESIELLATYGDFVYVVNDDNTTVSITDYRGTSTDVVVPAKIEGKDVTVISLSSKSLTSLNVTACTALKAMGFSNTSLTSLDVSKNPALTYLYCMSNQLTVLNVNGATALTDLDCTDNQLTTLDVSNNPALTELYCNNNQLTTLDVNKNPALTKLYCYNNQLTALNVNGATALTNLSCWYNQLTTLCVSNNPALTYLYCFGNQLTALDVSNNTVLTTLSCVGNQLTELDVSKNTELTNLQCSYNYLPDSELQAIENLGYAWQEKVLTPQNVLAPNPLDTPVEAFVERLYTVVLGRDSDPDGKANHVNALTAHVNDGAHAAYGFFFSEELSSRGLSDEQWIDICYRTFLDRDADADGRQNWLNALASGASRYFVFSGFVGSDEFSGICASYGIDRGSYASPEARDQSPAVRAFVYRLYTECLGRTPEPDGLNNWCAALLSGQLSGTEAARGFFYSEEFETKYTTNEEIVTAAYKALLGRDPDPAGLADWVSRLDNGASKEVIFHGFGMSPEFQSICASYGINQGTLANPGL